jgi:branched-chain amino acid transport system permease protein
LNLIVALVAGGIASLSGPITGAALIVLLPHITSAFVGSSVRPRWSLGNVGSLLKFYVLKQPSVLFGLLLLLLVFVMPLGVADGMRRLRARFVTVVPNPWWLRTSAAATGTSRAAVAPRAPAANVDAGVLASVSDPTQGGS